MQQRVLIVDDSQITRKVAKASLEEANFLVVTASSGAEAINALGIAETAEVPDFDAVLLDIVMPRIDGLEVLKEIRDLWNEVQLPVIMITTKDKSEDVIKALNLGANDYVTKPLDQDILLARLKTHLKLKEYHESLKRAQDSLLSAARIETVGLLAAGVAHEIRNPLGRIQMAITALKEMPESICEEDRATVNILIETAAKSITGANTIIEELMASFSSQRLSLRKVDVNKVLLHCIDYLRPEIQSSGISLEIDFADDPPPVPMAEEEFQQAFVAILRNAIQAVKSTDGLRKTVSIATKLTKMTGTDPNEGTRSGDLLRDGDDVICISIEDSGPGMTADQRESAFDAFFTTKATGSGTGLGLTVARKIIDLHNGIIRLKDRRDGTPGLQVSIMLKTKSDTRRFV